jgi:GNAT superfamily N-acetyltransferase
MSEYFISTDKSTLDLDFIARGLATTYWAAGRPRSTVQKSIANSLCFGVYETASKRQVGFARVVTDWATFSWLCDVYVDLDHRGHGLGKRLVAAVVAHPELAQTKIQLGTRDAHGLYEQFGFERIEMMRRTPPPDSPAV